MTNAEYAAAIKNLGLTRAEFCRLTKINPHTVDARCRPNGARTRITPKAEIEMLRFALARTLRMNISGPMAMITHAREIPPEFVRVKRASVRKAVRGKTCSAA